MKLWKLLFGGIKKMETDAVEIKALREKVKSLIETIDLQLEVMEDLQKENDKLRQKCERLERMKGKK